MRAKLAFTFTGMLTATVVASLICLAVLLVGAAQGGVVEGAVLPLPGAAPAWRREAIPWLLFGLTALGGVVVLAAIALLRARQEAQAQHRMMKAAEALEIMLDEKDALLAEMHHRVKNNMQVVVNLLQLEAAQLSDGGMRRRLDAIGRRIALIGQVHERVYAAERFARMNASAHLAEHCAELAEEWPEAELRTRAEALYCRLDVALPVALIAHELVANALRHAGPLPAVEVSLRRDLGEVLLRVKDNGPGPATGTAPGMGSMLVALMAEQVGALVGAVPADGGYAVEVRLPAALFE